MKQIVKTLLVFYLVAVIAVGFIPQVAAYAEQNNTSQRPVYTALFSQALESDGAESEHIAAKLASEYDCDATGMLNAMNERPNSEITVIAKLLVYGHLYSDFEAFKAGVNQQEHSLSANNPALRAIVEAIASLEACNTVSMRQ